MIIQGQSKQNEECKLREKGFYSISHQCKLKHFMNVNFNHGSKDNKHENLKESLTIQIKLQQLNDKICYPAMLIAKLLAELDNLYQQSWARYTILQLLQKNLKQSWARYTTLQ